MEHAPVADRSSAGAPPAPGGPIDDLAPAAEPDLASAEGCPVGHAAPAPNPSLGCPVGHTQTVAAAVVATEPGGPVDHDASVTATVVTAESGCPIDHAAPAQEDAARCPVPGVAAVGSACPIDHTNRRPVRRTKADLVVRRLLRIPDRPDGASQREVYAAFQKSMLISATRCTLTYVIFPFVLPAIGLALTGLIGVVVGLAAMVADVFTIRRFFAVDHRWRWQFSAVVFGIMCLLTALLVQDISHLLT